MGKRVLVVLAVIFVFVGVFFLESITGYEETSTFYVNVIPSSTISPIVRIQVPDSIFLGNVTVGEMGDEIKVTVNNTGNTNIMITPELVDGNDEIMSNLFFRFRQTNLYNLSRAGDFSFDISKPGTSGYRMEYFWASLNLSSYNDALSAPLLNHEADVRFVAVAI
ncbi:MAG: hypothetical protein AABX66_00770 [Nanoarchaeota archaeon]